jgi:heptose I phosphotransferase
MLRIIVRIAHVDRRGAGSSAPCSGSPMGLTFLRDDLRAAWGDNEPFAQMSRLDGEVYRAVANRRTVRFEVHGRAYFAKTHEPSGWGEIIKNLLTLRMPVVSARNEYEACRHLERCGIRAPTVAAYGVRGCNPARRESFIVTDALEGVDNLEELGARWRREPPDPLEIRALVMAVAEFARRFHDGAGMIHRDFYLSHLLLDRVAHAEGRIELAVLDLHRARIYRRVPGRWRRRDLAALLYASLELPIGRRNWYRFLRVYRGRPLREILTEERRFWRRVERRARALYRKGIRKGYVQGPGWP